MKNILLAAIIVLAFAGCAAEKFAVLQEHANLVKNGMTVNEVVAIVGTSPNLNSSDQLLWEHGKYHQWNGTPKGAIRFLLKDGMTYGIPMGGVISPDGVAMHKRELDDAFNAKVAEQQAQAKKDFDEKQAQEKRALDEELAEAKQSSKEIANESAAASGSRITCHDKQACTKMFALAQVYVSSNADQKIQVATDTIIETYNPTETMSVGMKIVKMPQRGTNEELIMSVMCREDDTRKIAHICRKKRTVIYAGFRDFVESGMGK